MLKNRIVSTLLLSSLLLAACQDETPAREPNYPEQTEENGNDQENNVTENENNNTNYEEENPENDEDDGEDVAESSEDYLYEVDSSDSSIVPIEGTDANERVALLTYDDVPDDYAVDVAHILDEHDAPAIFFVNGMYIEDEEGQEDLREIYEMGFEIGNHTHTHADLQTISEENQYDEIMETSDLIEDIIGERPRFFRAPFGNNTDYSKQIVEEDGMTLMNWTYGYDFFEPYMEAEKLAEAMVSGEAPEIDIDYSLLKPGANLLMHDLEWTMEATPDIIEGLRDQDYELVDPALIQPTDTPPNESEETNE